MDDEIKDLKRWIGKIIINYALRLLRNKWEMTERKGIYRKILVALLHLQKNHYVRLQGSNNTKVIWMLTKRKIEAGNNGSK